MKNPRVITKRTRFEIFKRDGFRCQYCGETSESIKLVIDHVIPVCKGGTCTPENLVTSCEICNQGKAGNLLDDAPLSEDRRLEVLQERREREEAAKAAIEVANMRKQEFQSLVNFWCDAFDIDECDSITIKTIFSYVQEFDFDTVCGWILIAQRKFPYPVPDKKIGKYISGIRRSVLTNQLERDAE